MFFTQSDLNFGGGYRKKGGGAHSAKLPQSNIYMYIDLEQALEGCYFYEHARTSLPIP